MMGRVISFGEIWEPVINVPRNLPCQNSQFSKSCEDATKGREMIQELRKENGRIVKSFDQKRSEGELAQLCKIKLVSKRASTASSRKELEKERKG
jgi:hypothetical protein